MIIYHHPGCSKSRRALSLILESGIEPTIIEYLKTPPSQSELDQILIKLEMQPEELMRKKETCYQELSPSIKTCSRQEQIHLMISNPILIERPIVIKDEKVLIARPPEKLQAWLE